jgi:hypothetical protein
MGIHRSDYLLDYQENTPLIKQVEINTIASSFSSLSSKTEDLHRYLSKRTDYFNKFSPLHADIKEDQLPENTSRLSIAKGLAQAWKHYGNTK